MKRIPLKDVSIFNIRHGDQVLDQDTGLIGDLEVKETNPDCLDIFAHWLDLDYKVTHKTCLNQYDTKYILIKI